ncbi:serine kinase [Aurantiacibacter xanthus]|uniref:Serine kinase n=1 Tax=Aurantiacibacter xanthus TaxID=1784712 RepID=A0A3A1PC41_9SPHN|nr:HPr kinase/phosphatase C-terminal domain-containing protein [Aurantiacibacter xanthus]RIV91115.1 serine kinase [Aurantiacibacter xanthus]
MNMVLANVTCVALDGRALLIEGAPGTGKSSLALALIDAGAQLIGDDGVTLVAEGDHLIASPPPRIAGLIEVRGVGLVTLPTTSAPVALAIALDEKAPRLPDELATAQWCGISVPRLLLYPDPASLPLRARWALHQHGTPGIARA